MTINKPEIKDCLTSIETTDAAKIARLPVLVLSGFSTFLWGTIAFVTILGTKSTDGYYVFLYVAIFALIAYGLFKMRREAAIAYLIVSIIAVYFGWGQSKK